MVKPKERSFLDRALEALKDKYPNKRPTQVRIAEIAGVSQPAAREWDLPDRAPEHKKVLKIAKELNVCVEWLYTERGPKHPPPAEPDPFIRDWGQLDPDTRERVVQFRDFIRSNKEQ